MTNAEPGRVLRVGTRTSRLALVQTELFMEAVRSKDPESQLEVIGIRTTGDRKQSVPIPDLGQGVFVKELQIALANREIDLAMHSLKDLPTQLPPGHSLAAVMPRGDARDALVTRDGTNLAGLAPGSRVGTGSVRRAAQVLGVRPDLTIVLLRGNVDTRIRKVTGDGREIEADAAVLAAAGLIRLGWSDIITEYLGPSVMLPAVGQGFIGIECRDDDADAMRVASTAEDVDGRIAAEVERAFLAAVGGFCKTPLACFANIESDQISVEALVASVDGRTILRETMTSSKQTPPGTIGRQLLDSLSARGADDLIVLDDPLAE